MLCAPSYNTEGCLGRRQGNKSFLLREAALVHHLDKMVWGEQQYNTYKHYCTYQYRKAWNPLGLLLLLRTFEERESLLHQWHGCNAMLATATRRERRVAEQL